MKARYTHETFLTYSAGDSPVHSLDARGKLIALVLSAVGIMAASPLGLPIQTAFVATALAISRLPVVRLLREGRGVFVIAILIVTASLLTSPTPLEGLRFGLLYAGRLILLLTLAQLFVGTTSIGRIRIGVARLLRPAPPRAGFVLSSFIALSVTFVALPVDMYAEVRRAATLRGLSLRRHPLVYLRVITVSVLVRTLLAADTTAQAFDCRAGTSDQRPAPKSVGVPDLLLLLIAGGVLTLSLLP